MNAIYHRKKIEIESNKKQELAALREQKLFSSFEVNKLVISAAFGCFAFGCLVGLIVDHLLK